jgi:hypothetical protein
MHSLEPGTSCFLYKKQMALISTLYVGLNVEVCHYKRCTVQIHSNFNLSMIISEKVMEKKYAVYKFQEGMCVIKEGYKQKSSSVIKV